MVPMPTNMLITTLPSEPRAAAGPSSSAPPGARENQLIAAIMSAEPIKIQGRFLNVSHPKRSDSLTEKVCIYAHATTVVQPVERVIHYVETTSIRRSATPPRYVSRSSVARTRAAEPCAGREVKPS